MTRPALRRPGAQARAGAALALVAGLALLAGCSGAAPEASGSPSADASTPPPVPSATPTNEPTPVADPTCDTIIPSDVVDAFEKQGWSSQAEPFSIGPTEIPDGILCTWGDLEVASDHVQMFGWAPISTEDADAQQTSLLDDGWIREDAPDGVYITENPETAAATDDDGYGWTYLFGDGWVKFADTKQGLLLVDWPPAG